MSPISKYALSVKRTSLRAQSRMPSAPLNGVQPPDGDGGVCIVRQQARNQGRLEKQATSFVGVKKVNVRWTS